jgi:hypothetical protein
MRHFWQASAYSQTFGEIAELEAIDLALESQCAAGRLPV